MKGTHEHLREYARLAKMGDGVAFLFVRHHTLGQVHKLVASAIENQVDAEIAADQVYDRAQASLDSFDPERAPIESWLLGIAKHVVADYQRKKAGQIKAVAVAAGSSDTSSNAPDKICVEKDEANAIATALRDVLSQLPLRRRRIIILRFFDDRSYDQIVATMHLPSVAAARQLLYYAIRQCGSILAKRYPFLAQGRRSLTSGGGPR